MPIERIFTDQLRREIKINWPPQKIISLVPSQTELLFDLGLDNRITGITKFCNHPRELVEQKTKIGGTKQLDISLIEKLVPDLIIANKEENEQSQIEYLARGFPVWISDIYNLQDALAMIKSVGEVTGCMERATNLVSVIAEEFARLKPIGLKIKVAYLIWRKPYMVAGSHTFIDHMLSVCGFVNVFKETRYPEINAEQLAEAAPDLIFLSSEPYPFKEKHIDEFLSIIPSARVQLVDGEMFSWYGSRLKYAPSYLMELLGVLMLNKP